MSVTAERPPNGSGSGPGQVTMLPTLGIFSISPYHENGKLLIHGSGSGEETVRTGSRWLNIDGRLGAIAAYGAEEMAICRPGRRQIGMSDSAKTTGMERTLYADQLCGPCTTDMQSFAGGGVIADTGYVLQSGEGGEYAARYAASDRLLSALEPASVHTPGVYVQGATGKRTLSPPTSVKPGKYSLFLVRANGAI